MCGSVTDGDRCKARHRQPQPAGHVVWDVNQSVRCERWPPWQHCRHTLYTPVHTQVQSLYATTPGQVASTPTTTTTTTITTNSLCVVRWIRKVILLLQFPQVFVDMMFKAVSIEHRRTEQTPMSAQVRSRGVVGRGRRPPTFLDWNSCTLVHCCNWLLTEIQCKIKTKGYTNLQTLYFYLQRNYWHYTHPLNGPLSGTTRVSRYQKGKTNLDFIGARASAGLYASLHLAPDR